MEEMPGIEDIKDIDPKVVAKKVQRKMKKYRKELTLLGTGVFVGYFMSKRKFTKREEAIVADINEKLLESFKKHEGNFRFEDGSWVYPIYTK